jgi:hypothetical protein
LLTGYNYEGKRCAPTVNPEQRQQRKSGWLASLGRGLRDNAALISALAVIIGALITALLTLVGVVIAQFVTVKLEDNRAREAELQTYLDDIGQMLLNEDNPLLEAEPDATLSSIARAKTLAILERIDPQHKEDRLGILERFAVIHEGKIHEKGVISLKGADLSGAYLRATDLSNALLKDALLGSALLGGAYLKDTNLSDAYLWKADLREAKLTGADLSDAYLAEANLEGATVRDEQLGELESLEGTTMLDGSKYD